MSKPNAERLLLPSMMPERVCAFALMASIPKVYGIWERFYKATSNHP